MFNCGSFKSMNTRIPILMIFLNCESRSSPLYQRPININNDQLKAQQGENVL